MKLQILIPQYEENEEIIKPLLDSISLQQNIDFKDVGVIICNDGTNIRLSKDFLLNYPFEIQYIFQPHLGVSAARQTCLGKATADYVMFCDADDMFYNMCGLWIIFREMEGEGFDTLVSTFIEETRDQDGKIVYINHDHDSTFVHGKVHRRQYLVDKDIKWNPKLTVHEDSYFNCLCQNCLDSPDRGKYCQTSFYLWKWRDDSVCRRNDKYMFETYNNMLDSNSALVREFLRRDMYDKAEFFCTSMIMESYYTMNKKEWINQENQEYRNAVEKHFKEYYLEFKDIFLNMDNQKKNVIGARVRNRMVAEGMDFEVITLKDWLNQF